MRNKLITTSILAVAMAFGSLATAQDANVSSAIEAKPDSWFNGSSAQIRIFHEANVDVEGNRASDIEATLQPRFYQPIFNSALTLQIRTNISLRQDASLDAPIPDFRVSKAFTFADEKVTVSPILQVVAPLNGDAASGGLILETFAEQVLEYDSLTVKPFVYNYSKVGFSGSNKTDARIGTTTKGAGAAGIPSVNFDKEPASVSVKDQDFGLGVYTEIGATFVPAITKGFSFGVLVEVDGNRESDYALVDGELSADESSSEMVWTTSPTLRLTFDITDNLTLEHDYKHSFRNFGGNSNQVNDFTSFASLKMKLY